MNSSHIAWNYLERLPVWGRLRLSTIYFLLIMLMSGCGASAAVQGVREGFAAVWRSGESDALSRALFPDRRVELPATPVQIQIPKIGVDVAVEAVGLDAQGAMGLPSQHDRTAWFGLGPTPGQIGNSVIAGHVNTPHDQPAVFWGLDKLAPGDTVRVIQSSGATTLFRVARVAAYPYDAAPMQEIFGFTPRAQLNLITCAGDWDYQNHTYSRRLVVYTTYHWTDAR